MSVVSILKSWALVIESGVNCLRSREQANKGLKVIPLFDFFFLHTITAFPSYQLSFTWPQKLFFSIEKTF